MVKKTILLPGIALLVMVGIFSILFYRMGTKDAQALADFPGAQKAFDQAISDLSNAVLKPDPGSPTELDALFEKAEAALAVLHTTASIRISSLTKNDTDLMKTSLEIASIGEKELDTLKAYRDAAADQSRDLDRLAQDFTDLETQRQAAYLRYLGFAQVNR